MDLFAEKWPSSAFALPPDSRKRGAHDAYVLRWGADVSFVDNAARGEFYLYERIAGEAAARTALGAAVTRYAGGDVPAQG